MKDPAKSLFRLYRDSKPRSIPQSTRKQRFYIPETFPIRGHPIKGKYDETAEDIFFISPVFRRASCG